MKIDFRREGKNVECKVSILVPHNDGEVTWKFSSAHSDEFYAGFACSAMQDQMRDAIEKMRRDAYDKGWKDAKSKKGSKVTWFSRFWDRTS